jgi:hypothetical protein
MWGQPRFQNVLPSPGDQLLFCDAAYAESGRVKDDVFHARGLRILKEVSHPDSGLKIVFYVPAWFPTFRAQAAFSYHRLPDEVTIGAVFRGTDKNLVGNIKADFELLWNKAFSNGLPYLADQATMELDTLLQQVQAFHPALSQKGTKVKLVLTGHSLGGFLAESCAVHCASGRRHQARPTRPLPVTWHITMRMAMRLSDPSCAKSSDAGGLASAIAQSITSRFECVVTIS